jgi:hypothetical protein
MPRFTRPTVLAATDLITGFGHAGVNRFLLGYGLENAGIAGSLRDKANCLARYLLETPERRDADGNNLMDTIVTALVQEAVSRCTGWTSGFDYQQLQGNFAALHRALERDGFSVEDGHLRRALPVALDLPAADDEVHALLHHFGFATPMGHLDQGIAAHARGDWAAANAQFRPFIESLLDEMAERLAGHAAALPAPGHPRRQWLAELNPPFFLPDLNEWTGNGTGFLEGFYRRLHPQGAHPGLSDEDDSTFRLHLVLLVARLLLRRLRERIP